MKDRVYKWFHQYASSFIKNDDNSPYTLKYKHSLKVAENARKIAQLEKLREHEVMLAEIIGLLHDCGRFEQYNQYQTFNDRRSVDHAAQSVRSINQLNVLEGMNEDDRQIVTNAVNYHNKKAIPGDTLTKQQIKFAQLIRDADKVDIYRVMAEQLKNPGIDRKTLFLNMSEEIAYSASITAAIRQHELANLNDMRTIVDFRLTQLSWVFDINFNATFILLQNQGHLQYLIDSIPGKDYIKTELQEINNQIEHHEAL